ncbi:MAG: tRNA (adenosine(37)-N6)-threonylcarbamoyltransferase complex ATPase subunit type 1 TsaE [Bacteroidales bacterium]|jgi:tRNA threonylcarbamoyladenosine biosynthesis protein TsaE|nr:tRNA (adenosine(37)-N6)-threonylcarbamoyltransferase complex ATPase subunit type 1 TsaE [Bacteroidales bacterium]MBO5847759.1 tRNA (adenosine(37)-N6)-threonylcarbamoyltransferase complex ATPase subunit type 1 TsaE [Bacteroidales bacterium]
MQDITFEINNIEELSKVSDLLLEWRDKSNIIAFYGAMGAGKTTLVKNLCQKLGVNDEVNSPTFALVNEYQTETFDSIFHFDFYRIKSLEEVFDIGYEDYFYGGSLCLLEWPELIDPLMPEHFIKVEITHGDTDTNRKIRCSLV